MSHNPNVEKAVKVLCDIERGYMSWQERAEKLDAAGLLVTPLMQEACEALAAYIGGHVMEWRPELHSPEWVRCIEAGRALLAAKKPGTRFTVDEDVMPSCWTARTDSVVVERFKTREAAQKYAETLNGVTP